MNLTILRKMTFWLALRLLDFATEEVEVDTYSVNAPFTKTKIHRLKSTKTIGLSSVMQVARAVGFTLLKRSRPYGKLKKVGKPEEFTLVDGRDFLVPANKGKRIKIHKVK